jgi:hypothetical protein
MQQPVDEQLSAQDALQAAGEAAAARQMQDPPEQPGYSNSPETASLESQLDTPQTQSSSSQALLPASTLQSIQQQRLHAVWQQVQKRLQQEDAKSQQQQLESIKKTSRDLKQRQKQQSVMAAGASAQSSSSRSSSSAASESDWPPLHATCFQTDLVSNVQLCADVLLQENGSRGADRPSRVLNRAVLLLRVSCV